MVVNVTCNSEMSELHELNIYSALMRKDQNVTVLPAQYYAISTTLPGIYIEIMH